jgi:hypothetical protein
MAASLHRDNVRRLLAQAAQLQDDHPDLAVATLARTGYIMNSKPSAIGRLVL